MELPSYAQAVAEDWVELMKSNSLTIGDLEWGSHVPASKKIQHVFDQELKRYDQLAERFYNLLFALVGRKEVVKWARTQKIAKTQEEIRKIHPDAFDELHPQLWKRHYLSEYLINQELGPKLLAALGAQQFVQYMLSLQLSCAYVARFDSFLDWSVEPL